jgi:hypothetical protein
MMALRSEAGWYIGWADEEGPFCRVSSQYFGSEAEAQRAIEAKSFEVRKCSETEWCSGGDCFR